MNHPMAQQIAGGPLRWRAWDGAAAGEARARDVPLAVLVGDALDAWTANWINAIHDDREVCALLEDGFVAVAAERNDHPALAALAQQVLAIVADASGLPCVLIMLPGSPPAALGAIPYAPVRDAEGRKGLARVLLEVAEGWNSARDELSEQAAGLQRTLAGVPFALAGGRLHRERALALAEAQLMAQAHTLEGGFGARPDGAVSLPRRPRPELIRLLAVRAAGPDAAPSLRSHLERTLAALASGGIHDQLGGGFHHAAADAGWSEPLWEQRLSDQAGLARAFLDGYHVLGQRLFRDVAEHCLAWAVHDLSLGDARYAAGRHAVADTPAGPVPGGFQRFTRAEAAAVVGAEGGAILARRFGLDDEAGALAVRGELEPAETRRLPELVARLAVARAERAPPLLDLREDLAAHGHLLGALHAAASLPDPQPALVEARDALRRRLAATAPASGAGGHAAVALGLAECGDPAAFGWLAAALATARDGQFPLPEDALVAPAPLAVEDTVDGITEPACAAWALTILGRDDEAHAILAAHAGLLMKAPLVSAGLCLALAAAARA